MTPTVVTPAVVTPIKKVVKRTVFDLAKFERVSLEKEIEIKDPLTMAEALEMVEGDDIELLKIIQIGFRKRAISEAKSGMGSENFVSPKVISGFVNNFKPLYPALDDSKAAKDAQRTKIYSFIRGNEGILAAVKLVAAAMKPIEDEDDDETDAPE